MIEILLGILIGVILGTISGIIPGVHANTLAGVLLSLQVALLSLLGPLALAGAMFAALITHTFVDAIPSTFLGIPDADTSLAVLPAHALCLEGNGEEAVRIAALGSACAMVIAVPLSVLCFLLLPALQPYFDWWIGILLIASVGYMIVTSEAPAGHLHYFVYPGFLGYSRSTMRFSAGILLREAVRSLCRCSPGCLVFRCSSPHRRERCRISSSEGSGWKTGP